LAGLVTPPIEAAVLVGTTEYLLAEVRGNGDREKGLLLPFLLFTTQFFLPGVRWDPGAHTGLVIGFTGLMVFSAVICAVSCFLLARRHSLSRGRCMAWSVLGFVFGWLGPVLLLALLESPARIACPKCRKLRVVTRDTCEYCGAAQTEPEVDGTEIFESAAGTPRTICAGS
jgi:hypothetical protein